MSDIREQLHAMPSSLNDACRTMEMAADEIERLQEAKRRALQVADERAKENVELRRDLSHAKAVQEVWIGRARQLEAVVSTAERKSE